MEVSLLSATTTFLIGAGCFAIGYLLSNSSSSSSSSNNNNATPPDPAAANSNGSSRRSFISWARSVFKASAAHPPAREDVPDFTKKKKPALLEIESLAEILQDFKMVLVVRNDLKMGKGKIAAQCSHASLGLYKKLLHRAPKALNRWEMCGQVKVVLKVESEEDLLILQERAKSLKLPTHITIDAGRTQIAPNSRTVMAILGPDDVVDDVTGGLKLL